MVAYPDIIAFFGDYFRIAGDPDGNPEFAFQALDSRHGDLSLIENRQGVNRPQSRVRVGGLNKPLARRLESCGVTSG